MPDVSLPSASLGKRAFHESLREDVSTMMKGRYRSSAVEALDIVLALRLRQLEGSVIFADPDIPKLSNGVCGVCLL